MMYGAATPTLHAPTKPNRSFFALAAAVLAVILIVAAIWSTGTQRSELELGVASRNSVSVPMYGVRGAMVRDVAVFGRGDKRTKKGKRFAKSYGNCRQRKGKPNVVFYPQPPKQDE
eukprot:jgi/Bigna1/85808/estExt_fgenesh1_pg.C_60174